MLQLWMGTWVVGGFMGGIAAYAACTRAGGGGWGVSNCTFYNSSNKQQQ